MFRYRWLLLAVGCLYFGCASTRPQLGNNEALLPEIDVIQVKEQSDEALKLAQEAKLDVEVVTNKLTETDNRLILLSEEVSSVSIAKIEELENRLALLVEAYKDLQAQVAEIEARPPQVVVAKKKSRPATFSPSAAKMLLGSPEYDLYQSALRTWNSRSYDKAITMFGDLIKEYPKGEYADNARYWIGECFYAKGDYASAITSFTHVFDFKNSSKADDAQFKIGMSYLKMGQPAMAKEELNKLINRYPASEYIERAKKYLAEIR